jgi:tripeptide aminopeptidase
MQHSARQRFLHYAGIDTQSDPNSHTCPSTAKQKNLGALLVHELVELGLEAEMDENGYVYGTLKANTDKKVPVICFCSHMDTSPDCSGKDVKPVVHANYDGGKIRYTANPHLVLDPEAHPDLLNKVGHDIITSNGTTLLGADNKAGIAAIMSAVQILIKEKPCKHGVIKILFTPDEEIGRGVDKVNLALLGADFAYTVDGETLGHIENETFSADGAKLSIKGISAHPGYAKNKMVSALKAASAVVAALPTNALCPEKTEGREGFIHPVSMRGSIEEAEVQFIIRDFDNAALASHGKQLKQLVAQTMQAFPGVDYHLHFTEQYRNMKQVLDRYPNVAEHAVEAVRRAGIQPVLTGIRGGTDGSRLSFMGLPCPNIFAGEHAFHSLVEWVSVQDMEKAAETLVHLAEIWEEKA